MCRNLKWIKSHIKTLATKITKFIYPLRRLENMLNISQLMNVFEEIIVESGITDWIIFWGNDIFN